MGTLGNSISGRTFTAEIFGEPRQKWGVAIVRERTIYLNAESGTVRAVTVDELDRALASAPGIDADRFPASVPVHRWVYTHEIDGGRRSVVDSGFDRLVQAVIFAELAGASAVYFVAVV